MKENKFSEEKIAYLQMIQDNIQRMATSSALFKGFSATIVAGVSALSYHEINSWILGLSFLPVIVFFLLDIYYLRLERLYRDLFEQIRRDDHPCDFDMKPPIDSETVKRAKAGFVTCVSSFSIAVFYPLMIVILIITLVLKIKGVI